MANKNTFHRVVIYVRKDCDDKTMTPTQLRKWLADHLAGTDYGPCEVTEVTTTEDGKETDYKSWPRTS